MFASPETPQPGVRRMLYRARAPLRVSFAGGGTDVPPFPDQEGGLVLSATINRYAYATLEPTQTHEVEIESEDLKLAIKYSVNGGNNLDGKLDLAKATISALGGPVSGFRLHMHTNAPPGSGLGSSSAVVVTLIGVLREFRQLPLTDYEIAELAYRVEREDLKISGGLQDQYAATFGGFNFIEFLGDRVIVNPLRIRAETIWELEHNLLLVDLGQTRPSDHIIDDQTQRLVHGERSSLEALRKQKEFAVAMKNALLRGRLDDFGELLGDAWRYKKQMSPRVSTDLIEDAYNAALEAGAVSGKVTGAGGGGHMLFYCPRRKLRVTAALEKLGARPVEFAFDGGGLASWRATG